MKSPRRQNSNCALPKLLWDSSVREKREEKKRLPELILFYYMFLMSTVQSNYIWKQLVAVVSNDSLAHSSLLISSVTFTHSGSSFCKSGFVINGLSLTGNKVSFEVH